MVEREKGELLAWREQLLEYQEARQHEHVRKDSMRQVHAAALSLCALHTYR